MSTKTIDLFEPFEHHGQTVSSIALRPVTGGMYADLGEPRILVRTGAGGYWVEQPDIIRRYLDRCIVDKDSTGSELLKLMSLSDVIAVKDELLGFFVAAEAAIMSRRQTSSSST